MTFTQTVIAQTSDLCAAIRAMPFNRELATGTLAPAVFRHYMIQDAHYLEGFARALALTSARAPDADAVRQLAQSAAGAIAVERQMHDHYLGRFGVTAAEFAATPRSPACDQYVTFLIATAATKSPAISLAALLPCFWVYRDVGHDIAAHVVAENPYQEWIDTYSGPAFDASVTAACVLADRMAAQASAQERAQMETHFARSTLMEWMFWDSAYHQRSWPDPLA
ncbi:MAG: thiaminase II [Rhodobacteraceae bacterium]|nr:MAG: thiaminase II [Paracoccaceae bacterium]